MALARHSTSQAIDDNFVVYAIANQRRRIMRHLPLLLLADLNSLPIVVDFKYRINANSTELRCIELKTIESHLEFYIFRRVYYLCTLSWSEEDYDLGSQ